MFLTRLDRNTTMMNCDSRVPVTFVSVSNTCIRIYCHR
jgi:hypothetical protein